MRVDLECSCGAKLTVAYDEGRPYSTNMRGAARAKALIDQFRKDHKGCFAPKAAS